MCEACVGNVRPGKACHVCDFEGPAVRGGKVSQIDRWREMPLDAHEAEIQNAVYAVTEVFEVLEHSGKLRGNGHHARQEAAEAVAKILRSRWEGPK